MKKIGRYELLGILGRGGMGTVHRARDGATGAEVALKVVRVAEEQRAARLMREAELARRLDHPGVVRVLDAGRDGEVVFVAFELVVAARPLDAVLPTLAPRERVALLRDAARALGHAHGRGVVHRDVKAPNILVDAAGRARVTDFGIGTADDLDRLTRSGMIIGTPRCMAPEQATSARDQVGPHTDVWALGVLLHEALVGEHPLFGHAEPATLLAAVETIVTCAPRSPRDVDPTVPPALDAVVRRALRREPAERFTDGEAMAQALDRALGAPAGASRTRRRRRPLVVLSVVAGLVVVASVVTWSFSARDQRPAVSARVTSTSSGPAPDAPTFEEALARGDLDAAARLVDAGSRARLAHAYVDRARATVTTAPQDAARDLVAALRVDAAASASAEVRELAIELAYVQALTASDATLVSTFGPLAGDLAAEAWLVAAVGLDARGEPVLALAARERALERAASPLLRGHALVNLGRAAAAAEVLRPLVDDPVVGARARLWLADARRASLSAVPGEWNEAGRREVVALFDDVLTRDPSIFDAWLRRGLLRGELGDPGAVADLERACALAPVWGAAQAWQVAGYVNLRLGRWTDAVRALDRSLALAESDEARKQRGLSRRRAGDLRGAIDDLQRVADGAGHEQVEVLHGLIEARVALGETAPVPGLVQRLRRLVPEVGLDAWCARMLVDAGDLSGAEALLTPLLDEQVDGALRAFAGLLRLRARVERGDPRGALEDADLVVSLAPGVARAHAAMALARLAAGDLAGAGAALEQAATLPADDEDAVWLRLADAWRLQATGGDLERALASVDQVLAAPEPPWGLALAVRVLIRVARGDDAGARADAKALLTRLDGAPADGWTARVARAALGP